LGRVIVDGLPLDAQELHGLKDLTMTEAASVVRRRQFCARCGQLMFEFYRSPDGHFGLVGDVGVEASARGLLVRCPTCDGRYRLLERVDATGQSVARI
jgi:transcriptional regulator NrdR family protein